MPELGAFAPSVDEPFTGVPSMLPEAKSWSTSFGVITQGVPSARVQSLDGFSFPLEHVPYSPAPHAFSAAL